ncbi:GNAT family N-acetyltransferase, partial [Acinetobacter baumannii]
KYYAAATYAVINEGRVCATLVVLDFEMRLNGNFVKCGGIANVATDPSQRRGNLVKALMQHALQKLHDDKVPVSALHAFSFPYYERMGYA